LLERGQTGRRAFAAIVDGYAPRYPCSLAEPVVAGAEEGVRRSGDTLAADEIREFVILEEILVPRILFVRNELL
jgi:hypothetical protein